MTATRDARREIETTARSLRAQTDPPHEWLVADGASGDGTQALLETWRDPWLRWSSHSDSGVYDAWNQVLRGATGDWILFLGAGDVLSSGDTLREAAERLEGVDWETDLAYGDVDLLNPADRTALYSFGGPWSAMEGRWKWGLPMVPMHPGVFHRPGILQGLEPFDTSFRIAADNLLLLRNILRKKPAYLGLKVAGMPVDGMSARLSSTAAIDAEFARIRRVLGITPPPTHLLGQFLKVRFKILCQTLLPPRGADAVLDAAQTIRGLPRRFAAARSGMPG